MACGAGAPEGGARGLAARTEGGTDGARDALQVHVQTCDEERAGHATSLAHRRSRRSSPASCANLVGMAAPGPVQLTLPSPLPTTLPLLTSRRHVDLQRTSSAVCSPA